ncbi:MAG TPA: mechanosensitive ion channel domain-containing protein [Candidatus Thermoplasmatota archaeon]|nr:mechanosensitive ion channel domain-containing protein [Candidatus Thermoplasmatota archaeon]
MAVTDLQLPGSPLLLLLFMGAAAALVCFLVLVLGRVAGSLAKRTKTTLDDDLARKLPLPVAILAGITTAGAILAAIADRLDPDAVGHTQRILLIVFVAVGAWATLRILRMGLDRLAQRKVRFQPAARVTTRVVSVLLYALAFLTILSEYGISITPLLTGLGLAALAIGLALQETLANFFSGIWIQTEQPLAPGHYVRLEGQNVEGFVERVGWRTTRIRVLAGSLVVIPNSKVAAATVTDFTLPDPMMSVVMNFRFPFDVDPNRAMAILVEEAKEAAKTTPGLLEDPAPFANATPGIGDFGIGYSLIIKVRGFVDQWNAQTAVTARVWSRMQKEGIRLLYPTRINLQADGSDFAPNLVAKASRKPVKAPEGRDPREIEAEAAQQQIAARVAADAAKGKVHADVAAEAERVARGAAPGPSETPAEATEPPKPEARLPSRP